MTAKKDSERDKFEQVMTALFKAPKPSNHLPKKRCGKLGADGTFPC
jgi:hypothetical protein